MKKRCPSIKRFWRKELTQAEEEAVSRYFDALEKQDQHIPKPTAPNRFAKSRIYDRINEDIALQERRRSVGKWRLVAVVLLLCFSAVGYRYFVKQQDALEKSAMVQVTTAKGEMKKIVLGDGSLVWLNAESSLTYPESFGDAIREVELVGEAYFEIAPMKGKPFVVESSAVRTKVLGTSFHVKAYDDDEQLSIGLLTGKVAVEHVGEKRSGLSEVLRPGEMVVFNKADASYVKKENNQLESGIAWRAGRLVFRNAPLPEVVRVLQRQHDVTIRFDPSLSQRMLYADFDNLTISSVLNILSVMLSCEVIQTKDGYLLNPR